MADNMSSEENLYIICSNKHKVRIVSDMAREMKLDIPITY